MVFCNWFKFCETYTATSSVIRDLLIETLWKLLTLELLNADLPYTYTCMF